MDTFWEIHRSNYVWLDKIAVLLGDMYPNKDGEEPEWVKTERDQFTKERDPNNDGKMDRDEIEKWIMPQGDDDHIKHEAKHLMEQADLDKVCVTSRSQWHCL